VLADAPGQYGRPDARTLAISITMVSRLTAWLRAGSAPEPPPPGPRRRLEVAEWTSLLDALISTLTEPRIVAAIANLANIDASLVPPPRIVHLISEQELAGFLPAWLQPVPGATEHVSPISRRSTGLTWPGPTTGLSRQTYGYARSSRTRALTGMERLARQLPQDLP
jgi:hypothetical protein